jgi:hypothetical protein
MERITLAEAEAHSRAIAEMSQVVFLLEEATSRLRGIKFDGQTPFVEGIVEQLTIECALAAEKSEKYRKHLVETEASHGEDWKGLWAGRGGVKKEAK